MKKELSMYRYVFLLVLTAFSFSLAVEGYVITQQIQISSLGSGNIKQQKIYITENAIATVQKQGKVVQLIDNGKFRIFRYEKETGRYVEMTKMIPMVFAALPFFTCTPAGCELRKNVFLPTDEYKKFGKYRARKVLTTVSMFGIASNIANWYTKDYKELVEAEKLRAKFLEKAVKAVKKSGVMGVFNVNLSEFSSLLKSAIRDYGGLIASESNLMGGKSFMRVISVEKIDIDPSFFRR